VSLCGGRTATLRRAAEHLKNSSLHSRVTGVDGRGYWKALGTWRSLLSQYGQQHSHWANKDHSSAPTLEKKLKILESPDYQGND
jgi:hypothetical protein